MAKYVLIVFKLHETVSFVRAAVVCTVVSFGFNLLPFFSVFPPFPVFCSGLIHFNKFHLFLLSQSLSVYLSVYLQFCFSLILFQGVTVTFLWAHIGIKGNEMRGRTREATDGINVDLEVNIHKREIKSITKDWRKGRSRNNDFTTEVRGKLEKWGMHEGTGKIIIPRLRFGHAGFNTETQYWQTTVRKKKLKSILWGRKKTAIPKPQQHKRKIWHYRNLRNNSRSECSQFIFQCLRETNLIEKRQNAS